MGFAMWSGMDTRERLTREIAATYDRTHFAHTISGYGAIRELYRPFLKDLRTQFDLLRSFVDITVTDTDPYADAAPMWADIRDHRHLAIYSGGTLPAGHPMADTAMLLSDRSISWNIVFRAVHDGLAHYPGRNDFSPAGEWRAFQAHARLCTSDASRHAMFTETLGQNAWMQIHGEYAPQKAVLLPYDLVQRAIALSV